MAEEPNRKDIVVNGVVVGQYESTGDMKKDIEICHQYLKDKGLWKEVDISTMMFNQAQSFAKTANDLYTNGIKASPRNFLCFTPFVVNAAFSIEVYLKTIHKMHGQERRGHSLNALYKSLPKEAKRIIEEVAHSTKNNYNITENIEFINYLSNLDRAFEQWRYIYESDTEAIEFLKTIYIMQALDKACIVIKKSKT